MSNTTDQQWANMLSSAQLRLAFLNPTNCETIVTTPDAVHKALCQAYLDGAQDAITMARQVVGT